MKSALVIADRLHWREPGVAIPKKRGQAAFDFPNGTLLVTEAGSTRRASLHVAQGEDSLRQHDRGGIEVLESGLTTFGVALRRENHTLKARADRPAPVLGDWERLLRRDPARCPPLAAHPDPAIGRPGYCASPRGNHPNADGLGSTSPGRGRGWVSGKGHGLSPGHGRARTVPGALSRLRIAGSADRLRQQRGQLLRHLSDQRQGPRRPSHVETAQGRLAANARGMGGEGDGLVERQSAVITVAGS